MGQHQTSKQLLALMAARKPPVRQAQLARDMGITPTSIGRYLSQLDADTIDDRVWSQMAEVLSTKYGIAAAEIRPVRQALAIDTSLTPYLDAFKSPEQLTALIKILEGGDKVQARHLLLVMARDRLARR